MNKRKLTVVRMLMLGLMLIGSVSALNGGWIWGKAALASYLIEDAWQHTLATGEKAMPWRWADTWPVASLRIGKDKIPVLNTASGEAMAFGVGLVQGSTKPEDSGNIAVAGHRDTHFAVLRNLVVGQSIALQTQRGVRYFQVTKTQVVDEHRTDVLSQQGPDRLTLITCYPFDAMGQQSSQRFIVTALEVSKSLTAQLAEGKKAVASWRI